ncbi:MAG: transposase [Bacteroides sp.]
MGKKIRTCINTKYTKTQNAAGASAYDSLMLFKILLLETWYGLNDRQIEERINDSLSFSRFIGLSLEHRAPDHSSTISRFRTAITSLGLMDKLLKEINKQFRKLKIDRIKEGIIVDATIVDSPNMPHRPKAIVIAADREDTRSESEKMSETSYQYELQFTEPGVD